ncbi:MAG TPA: XrtA-associated ATPase [Thiobacillaceae bacterium]|nr:XrtA-associated ATPase [Thiobacillaceae bacterium]HNU64915.1 XrtA-associated ATPase [Thiobacillaceae bacterium]
MYESYYHLRDKPFQLNPDPRFFFASRGHKRAFAYLEYGLSLGEGFIVITGDVGAGKTMLVKNLLRKLEKGHFLIAQLVSTQLDADDTLRSVALAFGLQAEGLSKSALLKALEDHLRMAVRQNRRPLLIVDEAQNLNARAVEELRMLSNFHEAEKPLLQSFLLGQPEFRDTIQSPEMLQLRQRVIASYHLGPLDRAETVQYIMHRLNTVGWQGESLFSEDAYDGIFQFTAGVPRRINTLCDRLLLFGFLEERKHLDSSAVQEVIGDLRQEVHHQTPLHPHAVTPREPATDVMPALHAMALPEDLDLRLTAMERTLNRLVPMVRKVLYTITSGQENE